MKKSLPIPKLILLGLAGGVALATFTWVAQSGQAPASPHPSSPRYGR